MQCTRLQTMSSLCSIWLEVFWAGEHNRRVDGDWLLQIANTSVGQQEPLHRRVECDHTCLQRAPPTATNHHDNAPTLSRSLTQTCGTLLIQNLCRTCCKQDSRHGIYSKPVTSIWSQQPWQHLYQSSWCHSTPAEKYHQGCNWMQRSTGDYSDEQTGNEARSKDAKTELNGQNSSLLP